MDQPQLIFDRLIDTKEKARAIKSQIKEVLEQNGEYQEITDKLKVLRENKKRVELAVIEGFSSEAQKLDDLQIDIESDVELFTDVVMNKLMKGESIDDLVDKYKNEYEIVYKVTVKKKQ